MLVLLEILLVGHRVVNIQGFSSFKEEKWSKMSKNFIFNPIRCPKRTLEIEHFYNCIKGTTVLLLHI